MRVLSSIGIDASFGHLLSGLPFSPLGYDATLRILVRISENPVKAKFAECFLCVVAYLRTS
jgi:hypothetical protein